MPKFKITSAFSLRNVLASMGMPLAFSNKADFSRMSTRERLTLWAVIHKSFVEVSEEMTEAASATAAPPAPSAGDRRPATPIEFRADHPFVFLIRDNQTQSILFMGRLVNPKG